VAHPKTLRAFLDRAKRNGIEVWVVEGDPYYLTLTGQRIVMQRARTIQAFNETLPQAIRLKGVQYDIEPYLMPGYFANPSLWNLAYVSLMDKVKTETGLAIDSVLPFWFDQARLPVEANGKQPLFLDAISAVVDKVTVMDYRTNPDDIEQMAKPFLEWGNRRSKPVAIALETGSLPDDSFDAYRPEPWGLRRQSRLWLVPYGPEHQLLVLLSSSANLRVGEAFRYSHSIQVPSQRVTYHKQFEQFESDLGIVTQRLSKWSSFSGMAIHYWGSYRQLKKAVSPVKSLSRPALKNSPFSRSELNIALPTP
jgi:hypothetical protein